MKEIHIELKHLQKSYARPVLTDVNLDVTNESYVTIVGKSGSGKSTINMQKPDELHPASFMHF